MAIPEGFSEERAKAARGFAMWMWQLIGAESVEMLSAFVRPGESWDDPEGTLAAMRARREALGLTASQCRSMGHTQAVYVLRGGAYGFLFAPMSAEVQLIDPSRDPYARVVVVRPSPSGAWDVDLDADTDELETAVRVDLPPDLDSPVN